jgi:Family of unknown function (DUF5754)
MTTILISKSSKPDKKLQAQVHGKTVHFGAKGYEDYTTHKDPARKDRYIQRHKGKEQWGKQGIETAGFYAKHVLWNKPTIQQSINDLNHKYKDITVKLK